MFRDELNRLDEQKHHLADKIFKNVVFSQRMGLVFTVVMWYIGMMLGSFVAAWYLVPAIQKRNLYASIHAKVYTSLSIHSNHNDFDLEFPVCLPFLHMYVHTVRFGHGDVRQWMSFLWR